MHPRTRLRLRPWGLLRIGGLHPSCLLLLCVNHPQDFSEKISNGAYGDVYKGFLLGVTVAVKKLLLEGPSQSQEAVLKMFTTESQVLGCLYHPNLLPLMGSCPSHAMLVYEYLEGGSLEQRLFDTNTPPLPWTVSVVKRAAGCLTHLVPC